MKDISLKAIKREDFKQSAKTNLRKNGMIPGVFYGTGEANVAIAASELALRPLIYTTESHIVNLNIDGDSNTYNCILKDVQFHPLSDKPIHFDLFAVQENKPVAVEVPVMLIGQSAGVKEGGHLQHLMHKLEIECLPKDIPAHIDVNISNLAIGDSISVGDLNITGVKFLNDANASVVIVTPPIVEKTGETLAPETNEPEVISKSKKDKEE